MMCAVFVCLLSVCVVSLFVVCAFGRTVGLDTPLWLWTCKGTLLYYSTCMRAYHPGAGFDLRRA